jgi:hypothetical protein
MNLTNKIEVKEIPKIIEVVQPTISKVECNQETITAYLSDTRVITIPTG